MRLTRSHLSTSGCGCVRPGRGGRPAVCDRAEALDMEPRPLRDPPAAHRRPPSEQVRVLHRRGGQRSEARPEKLWNCDKVKH